MKEYAIKLSDTADEAWRTKPSVIVGRASSGGGEPDVVGLVSRDGIPIFSIGVCADADEYVCFQEAVIWQTWAVVGYGHSVYFIDLLTQEWNQRRLDGMAASTAYFGHLYAGEGYLLVATASNLVRFGIRADVIWVSAELGIDGVVIHDVDEQGIRGDGEWDPPGGWSSFTVDLQTGAVLDRKQPGHEQQPNYPSEGVSQE